MSRVPEDLWELLDAYLQAEGLELDDLDLVGQDRGSVLRVTVDMDGGVEVDRLAETSRGLARLLEDDQRLQKSYTLEVTSPGLERKLRRPAHYSKSIGQRSSGQDSPGDRRRASTPRHARFHRCSGMCDRRRWQ